MTFRKFALFSAAAFFVLLTASPFISAQSSPSYGSYCSGPTSCTITTPAGAAIVASASNYNTGAQTLTIDGVSVAPLHSQTVWYLSGAASSVWVLSNASASAHTVTVTNVGGDHYPGLQVISVIGTGTINPVDSYITSAQTGGKANTCTVTTTQSNDLLVSFETVAGGPTASTGVSTQTMTSVSGGFAEYGTVPTASSASAGWNISASQANVCEAVAFKPAPAVAPTVTSVVVSPSPVSVVVNAHASLTAVAHYSDDSTADVTANATWVSSNTDVATVSALGVINPVTVGNSAVTASYLGTSSANDAVTVTAYIPKTWYVRTDGGTRFSSNQPTGQCDGTADVSYASTGGTGTNQHCAFNDVRLLWQDRSYTGGLTFPGWGWIGSGGDTYLIRGSIGTGVSYRVGSTNLTGLPYDGWGLAGATSASGAPPPPSGTASQHTRILGENFGSCQSQSARTQLHGGSGVGTVLALNGSSYVDVACLDITDFSACGRSNQTLNCEDSNGANIEDYASVGISINNKSTHVTLTDVRLHGLAGAGILGSPGDGFVATDIAILGNANSGWNGDDNSGTTGVGSMLVQNFNISWNGCAEEYPIVDSVPYGDCTDQSSGGYGDGFGTATVESPAPGWQVHFDNGTVSYNTQDGLDALHIGGHGSTMTDTRVLAFGNEGQQLKVGGATATIQNSVIVGNCEAMVLGSPLAPAPYNTMTPIPGTPAGFGSKLASPCRAGDTAVVINVTPGDPAVFQDNTIYEGGSIGLEVEYATADNGPTNTLKYDNNVFFGFFNSGTTSNATMIFSSTDLNMLTNPGASWTNNVSFGQRANWTCPNAGETNAVCTDPGLVDETYHPTGFGNMSVASATSVVVGKGRPVSGLTTDFLGNVRSTTAPTIGAYELVGNTPPPVVTLVSLAVSPATDSIVAGATVALTCTATYSDATTKSCVSPTWASATPSVATVSSGTVTGVAAGSAVVSAAIGSVSGSATVTVTAVVPPPPAGFSCTVIGNLATVGSVLLCK